MGGSGGEGQAPEGSGGADRGSPGDGSPESPSRLSRVVAAASGALVLVLVGYLLWMAVTPDAPPSLSVEVARGEVRRSSGLWYVPLDASNDGDASAKEVLLTTTLEGGAEDAERAEVDTVVDYLAGGESRRVYAVFSRDPADGRLTSRVSSYQEP